jgi:hypothetical protein
MCGRATTPPVLWLTQTAHIEESAGEDGGVDDEKRLRVDTETILRRIRQVRSQEGSPIGLTVRLPGLTRLAAAQVLTDALGAAPIEVHQQSGRVIRAWPVYPTENGPLLWITDATQWEELVHTLTRTLGEQHIGGTVTAPFPLEVWEMLNRNAPQPAAQLAFPLTPGIEDGPVNVSGRPAFRWGVLGATTEKVIAESVEWVGRVGNVGVVGGGGPTIPASVSDAGDLIRMRLDDGKRTSAAPS